MQCGQGLHCNTYRCTLSANQWSWMAHCYQHTDKQTHTHNRFTSLYILSGSTRVSRYQKKHSPTHINRGHQSSLICILHLHHVPKLVTPIQISWCKIVNTWQIFYKMWNIHGDDHSGNQREHEMVLVRTEQILVCPISKQYAGLEQEKIENTNWKLTHRVQHENQNDECSCYS